MIRRAEIKDIDDLAEMGKRFFAYSAFADIIPLDEEELIKGICRVFDSGIIFVAVKEDKLVGAICGVVAQPWFAHNVKMATELAWWMDDEYRGTTLAIGLLRAFESWAHENGAQAISMSDLKVDGTYPAGPLFERLGYEIAERAHVRRA